jgi:cytochrome c
LLDEKLERRIQILQKKITDGSAAPKDAADFTAIYPVWQDQQKKIESLLKESKSIRSEMAQGQVFYDSVKEAIAVWFNAYQELSSAFEENR